MGNEMTEKADETVKVPLPYLVFMIIALGGVFIYLIGDTGDYVRVAAAFVTLSLLAAAITFGLLGATA
jgi:hypothetical protein